MAARQLAAEQKRKNSAKKFETRTGLTAGLASQCPIARKSTSAGPKRRREIDKTHIACQGWDRIDQGLIPAVRDRLK
jgi:hypothetical protein